MRYSLFVWSGVFFMLYYIFEDVSGALGIKYWFKITPKAEQERLKKVLKNRLPQFPITPKAEQERLKKVFEITDKFNDENIM
jgi:hypothetical protein